MKWRTGRVAAVMLALATAVAACSGGDGGGTQAVDELLEQSLGPGERAITFAGANGLQLSGTLTVPTAAANAGADARVPVVLFVPTLGPDDDRSGPVRTGGIPDRLYLDLSNALVDQGFATFRYDRRGTARSPLEEEDGPLRFDDVVADAEAGVAFLTERAEVDPDRISVVAYDQAGLVALRVASSDSRVSRLVLLSTPGRPVVDALADEVEPVHGEASVTALRDIVGDLTANGTLPPVDDIPSELRLLLAEDPSFLASVFRIDPAVEAAGVDVPTLVVVSGVTPGVSKVDADRLAAAIGAGAQVLVTETAGPTLQTETRTTIVDPSDPAAGSGHEHDMSEIPSPLAEREEPVVNRILSFLGAGTE